MDGDLCKSFNAFFEQNEGWIITKNERGKIKVASCKEDETNIYEKTRDWVIIDADKTKTDTFKLPKTELYKCARNIPYTHVFICGTIVGVYEGYDKYSIIVDDGTSSIKCLINKEILDSIRDTRRDLQNTELSEMLKKNEESVLLRAAIMMKRSKKCLQDLVPTFEKLELGEIVKIFGSISEYNDNRYIFIKKITKEPKETISHTTYLEDMLHLYSTFYDVH